MVFEGKPLPQRCKTLAGVLVMVPHGPAKPLMMYVLSILVVIEFTEVAANLMHRIN